MRIKYYFEYQPLVIVNIGVGIMVLGGLPILLETMGYSLGDALPIDMKLLWLFEIFPDTGLVWYFCFILIAAGWTLSQFKWRRGMIALRTGVVEINGAALASIAVDSTIQLFDFRKKPRLLRIKSATDNLVLKFNSSHEQKEFAEAIEKLLC